VGNRTWEARMEIRATLLKCAKCRCSEVLRRSSSMAVWHFDFPHVIRHAARQTFHRVSIHRELCRQTKCFRDRAQILSHESVPELIFHYLAHCRVLQAKLLDAGWPDCHAHAVNFGPHFLPPENPVAHSPNKRQPFEGISILILTCQKASAPSSNLG
jgi:hypothetical protein